ncbi:hypothetical protein ACOJEA_004784 [Klebsiella aerogenes]
MRTSDYTIRKYLINKLSNITNLQFPSKATVENQPMLYIGDSNVQRTRVNKANPIAGGQAIPSEIMNLCEFRVEFVAVGENYKMASEQIEIVLDAIFTPSFLSELNPLLALAVFRIDIEESLMTTQAEATNTVYVHTQTISFSYGE